MQRAIDWDAITSARPEDGFDFTAERDAKTLEELSKKLSSSRKWPEQTAAIKEIARVYCAYRMAATGRGFGFTSAPAHRKMLDAAGAAAAHMITVGTTPEHVLKYLSRPGGTKWCGPGGRDLSFVPWNMYVSVKMIDGAASWSAPGSQVVKQTHSFDASAVSTKNGAALRRKLEAKFGKDRIDALTSDDGELVQKVALRAEALRRQPGLFLPPAYREIVTWLASNP